MVNESSYTTAQKMLVQAMIGRMCFDEKWARALFSPERSRADAAVDKYVRASGVVLSRSEFDEVKNLVLTYTGGSGGRGGKKVKVSATNKDCSADLLYGIFEVVRLAKCPQWPCTKVS